MRRRYKAVSMGMSATYRERRPITLVDDAPDKPETENPKATPVSSQQPPPRATYAAEMAVNRGNKARAARRRKRRMAMVEHDLTDEQWAALQTAWGGCAYCGTTNEPLQRDCVLALSRGGRYTLENIVPACPSCNTSKCNDEVTGWLRRKQLDERAFLSRHVELRMALPLTLSAEPDAEPAAPETNREAFPSDAVH
jgi:5-methylcytosine-specific restriction endonuclease McrA